MGCRSTWDINELWLAKAAPRRWFTTGFGAQDAPTRFGRVSFAVGPHNAANTTVVVEHRLEPPPAGSADPPGVLIRVRDPTGARRPQRAAIVAGGSGWTVFGVNATAETVVLQLAGWQSAATVTLSVVFE